MVSIKYLLSAALIGLTLAQNGNNNNNNRNGNNNGNNDNNKNGNNNGGGGGGGTPTLNADAIQTGSFEDGSKGNDADDGQAKSATSKENFINFCSGETLTNGLQVQGGSCNGIRE